MIEYGVDILRKHTHIYKGNWPQGPWIDEPDDVQWVDKDTGYWCSILRLERGTLCGYIGLPPEHPAHGFHYSKDALRKMPEDLSYSGIDHVGFYWRDIKDHEDTHSSRWWVGFYAARSACQAPIDPSFNEENYDDLNSVIIRMTVLAKELAQLK